MRTDRHRSGSKRLDLYPIPVKVLNLDERKKSSALPARVLAALG